MASNDTTETVAEFEHNGSSYEIDHLGICHKSQYGTFAIYRDGNQVYEFEVDGVVQGVEIPFDFQLIEMAKRELGIEVDDDV